MEMKYNGRHLPVDAYVNVCSNYYKKRREWIILSKTEQHLALCSSIAKKRPGIVFTSVSCCVARDIPRLDPPGWTVHCISTTRRNYRETKYIRWYKGIADEKATIVNDLHVASPVRAICDLAKEDRPESLLVSVNHCLYNKHFTKDDLIAEMAKHPRIIGGTVLRRVLELASAKCESPLETIAWIAIYNAKFAMPTQQPRIHLRNRQEARVDMYWEFSKRRIVLELDGKMKYDNMEVLYEEKRREDALRRKGYEVIRASWMDVENGTLVKLLEEIKIPKRRYFGLKFPASF